MSQISIIPTFVFLEISGPRVETLRIYDFSLISD